MNRKRLLLILIVLILPLLFSSCRNYPADVDILGLWDGRVQGLLSDDTFFIDFLDDGTARMLGAVITEEGANQEYRWSMDDTHLEFSVPFSGYKSLYGYKYTPDTLTLYMIDDTRMEPPWDNLIPGHEIVFTRAADGVSIEDLD